MDGSIHLRFEQNTSKDEGMSVLKIGRKVNRREWRENLSEINSVKRREPVEQYWGIDINGLKNDFLGSAGVQFFMCSAVKSREDTRIAMQTIVARPSKICDWSAIECVHVCKLNCRLEVSASRKYLVFRLVR